MKKNSLILTAAAFFLLSANFTAHTADARTYSSNTSSSPDTQYPWFLFIGGDIGYSHYSPYNNSGTEAPRGGFDGGFRVLLAHYWTDWVIDGGLGFQWISNQGTNSDGSTNTDHTTNAYVDFSPRYRWNFRHTDHLNLQVGPELEYWLKTDNGLNPTTNGTTIDNSVSNTSAWVGAQAILEWGSSNKFRVGARLLTDVSGGSGRTVYLGQAFFQYGFNVFGSPDSAPTKNYERVTSDDLDRVENRSQNEPLVMVPEATPWPKTQPTEPEPLPQVMSTPVPPEVEATPFPSPDPTPEPLVKSKGAAKVILTLDVNDLPFGTNNSNLPKSNSARVKKIGEFLKQNNSSWKGLVVAGYTDERGAKPYNLQLSKKRAEAVKTLLVQGGAPAGKIKTVGYGATHPLDPRHNEKAWAKNRRVELEFKGVKDVVLMKKAMNQ